jgi:hypothetical protein
VIKFSVTRARPDLTLLMDFAPPPGLLAQDSDEIKTPKHHSQRH